MDEAEVTDEDVRRSRHGYYANLAYVDEKVGEVLAALDGCGLADETVVIFLSDHGEFLGEHGLFYKMSFREHPARVPLIVHAPKRYTPRRVREPVSLTDLAPTLADLARPGLSAELARPVDGRSLVPVVEGGAESPEATVYGEYLAECVPRPMVMVRRGGWKFVHMPGDPDELFDLERDPLELENRASDEAALAAGFRDEVASRWDLAGLEQEVRGSQRARLAVFQALQLGERYPWDYQPVRAAQSQYTRNTMDVADRDRKSRFPPVPAP
jgi:choline-sulfatase